MRKILTILSLLWLLSIGGPLTQRTGIMLDQMRQETNYLLTMTVFKK